MTPERWHQVTEIFHAALTRDAAEREAFLDAACRDDATLRQEVAVMVAGHAEAGSFGEKPLISTGPSSNVRLAPGTVLGSFRIESLIGVGGMGEVYRATDTELGRAVAIKVLPDSVAGDADRLARMEREARVLAALNHPHIAAIYGTVAVPSSGPHHAGRALVLELVDGVTLAARLRRSPGSRQSGRPLPLAEAIEIARQIAEALEAAHDKGIIHRDLKPANVALTREGTVKVLDFGLAKAVIKPDADPSLLTMNSSGTREGMIVGTAAYMSPEQARGATVDKRTDIWAFGCVLYEMLTGRLAFAGATVTDTLAAVLEHEPDWTALPAATPSHVHRLLRRTLQKNAALRLRDAGDARLELLPPGETDGPTAETAPGSNRRLRWFAMGALALVAGTMFVIGRQSASATQSPVPSATPAPEFRQLTFRRGFIHQARFAADGRTIVYSAAWDGRPPDTFTGSLDGPESRSVGWPTGVILALSRTNEVAMSLGCVAFLLQPLQFEGCPSGTLATAPLAGGSPRSIATNVIHAEWGPAGELAVVRALNADTGQLEFPAGRVVHKAHRIRWPRFDAKGADIAAAIQGKRDEPTSLAVIGRDGNPRELSTGWQAISGLAWSSSGDEVWFTGMREQVMALHAVTLDGRVRQILGLPGDVRLYDISANGDVLLGSITSTNVTMIKGPDSEIEQPYSWFDQGWAVDLSADGRTMLFNERGRAVQGTPTMYVRPTDGKSAAVRLGPGRALALSADGSVVLAVRTSSAGEQLTLLPIGPGDPVMLPRGNIDRYAAEYGSFFPDARRVIFYAFQRGEGLRGFVQDVAGGEPRPITPTLAYTGAPGAISPDAKWLAGAMTTAAGPRHMLFPVGGGEPQPILGLPPDFIPIQWTPDGAELYARQWVLFERRLESAIVRVSLRTGRQTPWRIVRVSDPAGAGFPRGVIISRDARAYTYNYPQTLQDLYVARGLR